MKIIVLHDASLRRLNMEILVAFNVMIVTLQTCNDSYQKNVFLTQILFNIIS
ncbi:hypothetical protein THOM_2281 [Trachipleistophora hominis]|uniref:Uncharacterized protein n=1 Tax=Trachipleistophora hominis TaxID=72359 RepID=L7JTR1_TRAHO|nr:hypothetical protein THOM_2281 [Trachipleistophora hominis]